MRDTDPLLFSNRMPEIEAELRGMQERDVEALCESMLQVIGDEKRALLERISAGNVLGLIGDPRIDPLQPSMCRIPMGSFGMGTDEAEIPAVARRFGVPEAWFRKSTPRHEVELDAYEIGRFLVTESEYLTFIQETGVWEIPDHWEDNCPPPYRANHPVYGVSWQGILLYAEWISEQAGCQYRIPTEAEWERTARGTDRRAFPWGDSFEATRCNTREGGVGNTTPVGIYPSGISACGALDMAGNVEEYVADLYWPYPESTFEDGSFGTYRITRGGVYSLDADLARCDRRHGGDYNGPSGFRLVRSAADEWFRGEVD
ncbi:MAG: SUMF1/EgtB/PvdO family nonheme iron enzyme [Deltaproteobacteria bacterium]|nr:SUMF1/EgtB/PvdO family nonheme iron enzyme [Deltaproteobacteria bacterium]